MDQPEYGSLTLIKTKLHRPRADGKQVHRPDLLARLNQNLETGGKAFSRKLTLISAPAGFGKSTLVTQWLAQLDAGQPGSKQIQAAWFSLEEDDNDPVRFWAYFAAAIQEAILPLSPAAGERLGQIARPSPGTPQAPDAQSILAALINEVVELSAMVVVVLDDYHVIAKASIHEGIAFLIDHMPPQLHLALLTRADPPLPIARLRGRRQLTELREADLRFKPAEAATFLNDVMDLDLSSEEIQALEKRTEGWIVGLQLAAIALKSYRASPTHEGQPTDQSFIQSFTGSHHYILEYLTEEVLSRQPEPVRQFLLQTAILERLYAPLCEAVTGLSDSAHLLGRLQRDNLFIIPLDETHSWFRYHHLLADLLVNLLQQAATEKEIQALHDRASLWYEQGGDVESAIKHAIRAGHYKRAADLVENSAQAVMYRGRLTTLLGWLEALPSTLLSTRPQLQIYQGWALFLSGQSDQAERLLLAAKENLLAQAITAENRAFRGEVATLLATIFSLYGDTSRTIAEAQEGLAYLPEDAHVWRARATRSLAAGYGFRGETGRLIAAFEEAGRLALASGNAFLAADSYANVGSYQIHQGRLNQAADSFKRAIELASVDGSLPSPYAGLGYTGLADIYLERNDLRAAKEHLDEGLRLCRQGGIGYHLANVYGTESRLRMALGDSDGAARTLAKVEETLQPSASLPLAVTLAIFRVRYHLWLGEIDTAALWAERLHPDAAEPIDLDKLPIVIREVQQLSLASVCLVQERLAAALRLSDQVLESAGPAGRGARLLEAGLLKALAFQALEKFDDALASLEFCLTMAEPEGYVRLFLGGGTDAASLLKAFQRRPSTPARLKTYAGRLLTAFELDGQAVGAGSEGQLLEALTIRELDILRLIGRGHSNQAIADELFISLHTVKKHNSNIYDKLGVHSRAQAIARARELKLL